ncbi:MAG: OstA-like protein [Flavobacterium sp. MedPE-SWcel]|uniref:OstA-like protein n=1 Tax=uncultured Flavobacterium sp. TaxID=165435 RepID=UPI000915A480|nr:OstA-like protein [uncultured Flavobacterium sp.]OIQ17289.1 MAG: OstA-like protein [Flavobacterium sp. MedPE-SWcel]
MKKIILYISLLLLVSISATAQTPKKIKLIDTEHLDGNENEIPGAVVFTGDVQFEHNGANIWCNKAYLFEKENYAKLFGDVRIVQGDTIHLNSTYAEYNGNKDFAFASGNVVMKSPDMQLTTDTIYLDRKKQQAYYNSYGTIVSGDNTLTSKSGRYYIDQKKNQFLTTVTLTNPKYVLESNHLDYYTNSGHAYAFGPTTITSEDNYIYTEKGFYDTKKNVSRLLTNSYIKYDTQLIEGDSIYYDRNIEFSSITNNVKVTDTVNKYNVKGHYAEVYKQKDSLFITKHAVATTLVEKDSLYTHAKRIVITGKEGERVVRGYNNARFYKTDMSGKCDSIHSSELKGLTQLIGRPVVWNGDSQMTGDVIHMTSDSKTEQIDSLKVLNNAFIIQKDTLGTGYNQLKGRDLFGKFRDNKLSEVDLIKNTEKIYYMYNDDDELVGIDKGVSSKIKMKLKDNQIKSVRAIKKTESQSYPPSELPENVRKLRGFIWRGDEQIKNKEDIFPEEEKKLHEEILKSSKALKEVEDKPMEIMQETLDYDKNNPKEEPTKENESTTE